MKGLTIMYDNRGKKLGAVIAVIGLIAMIVERVHGFIIFKKLDVEQHFGVFEWFLFLGLLTIAFSREKYDDERAKAIRLKSLQFAFLMQQAVTLAMALNGTIHKDMKIEAQELFFFAGIGAIFYLLFFHAGLYQDSFWEYEDKGLWYNLTSMNKNKWGILAYFLVSAVALILLFLLMGLSN